MVALRDAETEIEQRKKNVEGNGNLYKNIVANMLVSVQQQC